jgi:hypothetical protein
VSDLIDDLGNVAGDLENMMVDATTGDYHAAAAGVDYLLGDTAGQDAHLAQMRESADAANADLSKAADDLNQGFKDVGFNVSELGTGPTIELD